MTQNSAPHRPLLVQAPVRALDPDGVAVVSAGTVAFAIGIGVCWSLLPQLTAAGKSWYLWVSVVGFVIGLAGVAFSLTRRGRRQRRDAAAPDALSAPNVTTTVLEPAEPRREFTE